METSRRAGGWLAVLAATSLAIVAAEVALPGVLGRALDAALGSGGSTGWVLGLAVLTAALVACDALDELAAGAVTARSTAWLRRRLVGHVLAVGPRIGETFGPGDVASRIVGGASETARGGPDLVRVAANVLPGVGGLAALALIDPWLCLTVASALPILLLLVRTFVRDATQIAARYFEVQGRIAGRLVDALAGARTIAAAGTADREVERVLAPLPELDREGRRMWRAQARIAAQDRLVVPLVELAALAVGGLELARGRIGPGALTAAFLYAGLATTVSSSIGSVSRIARSRGAAGRAVELLDVQPPAFGTDPAPPGPGAIELRGVTSRAGDRTLLDRVDLTLEAGSFVALVADDGEAASRLAALLGRHADPDEGEVLLDGVPLTRIDRTELRRAVVHAFERPALIGETVAGTIAFGAWTPSPREVADAARAARADDFIRRLPLAFATPLADAPMSGGEAQRLGLARAFAHAGRVVVLDDVVASLDTVTEHRVTEALTESLAGRTRIVVARRASTASRADVVVWLESGRVRAVAPHAELWEVDGYRRLFAPAEDPAQ